MSTEKPTFLRRLREVRVAFVLLTAFAFAAVVSAAALYLNRGLIENAVEAEIRSALQEAADLQFSVAEKHFDLFPVHVGLEGVTVTPPDGAWSLSVEDVSISVSVHALVFRRSGLARVLLYRPRLFADLSREGGEGEQGAALRARDVPAFLERGLPLRGLDAVDGTVRLRSGRLGTLDLREVRLETFLAGGRLLARAGYGAGSLATGGRSRDLGSLAAKLALDSGGIDVDSLEVRSPLGEADITGRAGYDGAAALEIAAAAGVEKLAAAFGGRSPLGGRLLLKGRLTGSLADPVLAGTVTLPRPSLRGERWPPIDGTLEYRAGSLAWKDLGAAFGAGRLRSRGTVRLAGRQPVYSLEIVAEDIVPGDLPPSVGESLGKIGAVNGQAAWEGQGPGPDGLAGGGSLQALVAIDGWKAGDVSINAEAVLVDDYLDVSRLVAFTGGLHVQAAGTVRGADDFSLTVEGGTDDLALFAGSWDMGDFGGRLSLRGALDSSPAGYRFKGPVTLTEGKAPGIADFELATSLVVEGKVVTVEKARFLWKGGTVKAAGTIGRETRQLDLSVDWGGFSVPDVAEAFGVFQDLDGTFSGSGQAQGNWDEPWISGNFSIEALRFGGLHIESAGGSLSYINRKLQLADVTLSSGNSSLSFSGEIFDNLLVSGDFESAEFDLRDFIPTTAAGVGGQVSGRLSGTVEQPLLEGKYHFDRLTYEVWDFEEAEGAFAYRDGAFTLEGSLEEDENSYSLVVEPSGDWPFSISIALDRFTPEVARRGYGGLAPRVREGLEGFSFLAVGAFVARGNLRDFDSISAAMNLKTLWLYTDEQTLQNIGPIRIDWKDSRINFEAFSLAGENYILSVAGGGGREAGWDLSVEGRVNLSLFQGYWRELEEVNAPGEVNLRITGEWSEPVAEGAATFSGGSVKLFSVPDPIVDIRGSARLSEGSVTLSDFSGKMGAGAFIAGGTYTFEDRRIDAFVEGQLNLAAFRPVLPMAREMSGPVQARLSIKGGIADPEIVGDARLEGAEIVLQGMTQRITNLTGAVILEGKAVELSGLEGRYGKGLVRLSGKADWDGGPLTVDLLFEGDSLLVVIDGVVKASLDASLNLTGGLDGLKLGGDVRILKARYFREFDNSLRDRFRRPEKEEGAGKGLDLDGMLLDVRLHAQDRLWIKNRMADLENSIDVHIGGTVGKPEIEGELRNIRGTVTYFNRRFELYSGRIFNVPPGFAPVLEAQAEVVVGETRIYLLLEGPLSRPTLQLTSLPPYSQEDLLALLTVGQTRSSLEEKGGQSLAVGAAVIFGTPVFEQVGEGAREVTGIEVFQVEPALGDEGSTARVTIGTHLSDRLFMSATQNIGVTEDQQVSLEYQILDHFSVLGQQLRQGIYSLDLVFSFSFE